MKQRVLICGDRNYKDFDTVFNSLMEVIQAYGVEIVIQGGAKGADTLGELSAITMHIPGHTFKANWKLFGKAAGPIRNQQMIDEGKPTLVLAFHDDIENSKGTKDMVTRARKAGIPVIIIAHGAKESE